ncbi:MAG: hypothetical protein HFF06_00795 [Oscillospiraceae bacterium]|jgi:uncharacterized membrane protein SpoIIM required for sporulation|nr:hypothetical protein [Oscillospiraceae bacterium]
MRRAVTGFWWSPATEGTPALVATAVFFALGGITGCLIAFQVADEGIAALAGYLDRFLSAVQSDGLEIPAFAEFLWRSFRWPLAATLLGFAAFGLLGLPLLASARGFFFAFSIASFARAYGREGLALAFFLLGIPGLFSIPAFLILTTQSLSSAYALAGRGGGSGRRDLPFHREHFFRCGVCAAAVCVSLLLERYLVPALVSGAAAVLIP